MYQQYASLSECNVLHTMEMRKANRNFTPRSHQFLESMSQKSAPFPSAFQQSCFFNDLERRVEDVQDQRNSNQRKSDLKQQELDLKSEKQIFISLQEKQEQNKKYATVDKDIVRYYQLQDYCEKLDTLIVKYCDDPILKNIRNESEQNYKKTHRLAEQAPNQKNLQIHMKTNYPLLKGEENKGRQQEDQKKVQDIGQTEVEDESDCNMGFWLFEVSNFISFLSSSQFKKLFQIKEDILSLKNPINHAVIRQLNSEYKRINKKIIKKNTLRRNLRKTKNNLNQSLIHQKQNLIPKNQYLDSEESELCEEDCHICRICWQFFDNGHQLGGHMAKKHPGNSQIYRNKRAVKLISCLQKKRKDYFTGLRNSICKKDQIDHYNSKKEKSRNCMTKKQKKLEIDNQQKFEQQEFF